MASATATAKKSERNGESRWFRLPPILNGPSQIDTLLDLYWGGPERRITGITLRIIAVNVLALFVLMLGIAYLSQYQSGVIQFRLDTFQKELELVAATFSESALSEETLESGGKTVDPAAARRMAAKFAQISGQRVRIFDRNGAQVADMRGEAVSIAPPAHFEGTQLLRDFTSLVFSLLPQRQLLPDYPAPESGWIADHPDARDALRGEMGLSAWRGEGSKVMLSAAAPLGDPDSPSGVVLLMREGQDIETEMAKVWFDILKIFAVTMVLTVTMSIYLSGVIARPLRKLARATEAVRKGQASAGDIPDLSGRHDEIGELSLALRQMTGALWERMDSLERFAADVSHELKNPLTSLRSAFETLEIARTEEDRQKLLGVIRHDLLRLDRLITDIATASRLEAELSRETPENIDVRGLLSSLIDSFARPLERQGGDKSLCEGINHGYCVDTGQARIILNVQENPGETLTTWGLEGRLAQVFQNILANALSFSPAAGKVTVTARPAGSRAVAVRIEDEGPGIPEAKLETVFERFYSERPQHEDYGLHSGLGLSICKQIVAAHGGRIFAENIRGEGGAGGARFTVVLNRGKPEN